MKQEDVTNEPNYEFWKIPVYEIEQVSDQKWTIKVDGKILPNKNGKDAGVYNLREINDFVAEHDLIRIK